MVHIEMNSRVTPHIHERPEYRFYSALVFPFSIVAAIMGRIIPGGRRGRSARRGGLSVFAEAVEINRGVVPWIFMGR